MNTNKKLNMYAVCAAAVLLIGIAIGIASGSKEKVDTSAGINYIKDLESQDVDNVIQEIRESSGEVLKEQYLSRIESIQQDESQVWAMFDDFLFMGDSRCVALVTYGFFNEENVIAAPTVNIVTHLQANMDQLVAKNPGNLYLIYGVNDICCGLWRTSDSYSTSYGEILDEIHGRLPNTKIYVNATMPVIMGRRLTSDYNGYIYIPDWNVGVKEMCDARDFVFYLDSSFLCDQYPDLYMDDGVHFVKEFYPHWAAQMIIQQYEYELNGQLQSAGTGTL